LEGKIKKEKIGKTNNFENWILIVKIKLILESKENNIQHTADNYPQPMPFNIYFNNSNENLINQQQHQQDQDSYSMQNNNISFNYYQSTNSLNEYSYSDLTTTAAVNNNQITTSSSGISSLNTNEYTTSETTLYSQISSSNMQSNWNDETQILDSICPINITYLPSFSTFFK
jgi:hypothetical protein